jgi:hypothetical protein
MRPEIEHWLDRNPRPGSLVVVAVDEEDRVVGHFAFIAAVVAVEGRLMPAVRTFAPIVSRRARASWSGRGVIDHPVVRMYQYAVGELREQGHKIIYSLPDPRWTGFFQLFPNFSYASFPLWARTLPLAEPMPLPKGYTHSPLTVWDESVDRLWHASIQQHRCIVLRDARTLQWKTRDHQVMGLFRHGELVGLVAGRQRTDHQYDLCDVLAAEAGDCLDVALCVALNLAHAVALERAATAPLRKAAILVPAALERPLHALGFTRDNYDFPFFVHRLDTSIGEHSVAPLRWYLSQND